MPAKALQEVKDWQNWNPIDPNGKFGPYGLVGAGPFMLDEYRPGEFVMMKRNEHYRMLEKKNVRANEEQVVLGQIIIIYRGAGGRIGPEFHSLPG